MLNAKLFELSVPNSEIQHDCDQHNVPNDLLGKFQTFFYLQKSADAGHDTMFTCYIVSSAYGAKPTHGAECSEA